MPKHKPHYDKPAKGTLGQKYVEAINNDNASSLPPHLYEKWAKGGLYAFGITGERATTDLTHRCKWAFTAGYGPGPNEGRWTCGHGYVILGYEWRRAIRYQGLARNWPDTAPLPLFIGKVPQKVSHASGPQGQFVNGIHADQPCDAFGNAAPAHAGSGPPGTGPAKFTGTWGAGLHKTAPPYPGSQGVNPHIPAKQGTWCWDGEKGQAIQTAGAKTVFGIATPGMVYVDFKVSNFGSEYAATKFGPAYYAKAKAEALEKAGQAEPATDPELEKLLNEEEEIEKLTQQGWDPVPNECSISYCGQPAYQKGAGSGDPFCNFHASDKFTKPLGAGPHDPETPPSKGPTMKGLQALMDAPLVWDDQPLVAPAYAPGDYYHTCPTWHKLTFGTGTKAICAEHGSIISWSEFITGKKADKKLGKLIAKAAKTAPTKADLLAKYQGKIPAPATPMSKQGQMLHAGDTCGANGAYTVTAEGEGHVGNPAWVIFGVEEVPPIKAKDVTGYFKAGEGEAMAVYYAGAPSHWIPLGTAPDGKQVWAPDYYCFGQGWVTTFPTKPEPKHPQLALQLGVQFYVLSSDNEVIPWYAGVSSLGPKYHAHSKHGKYLLYAHEDSYVYQQKGA